MAFDFERINALRDAVEAPLVLHRGSGVPEEALVEPVRRGFVKVNIATQLNMAITGAMRRYLAKDGQVTDQRRYEEVGRAAIMDLVRARCR